jgi:ABC-type iron transport system FetAB ATPase subunit
VSSEVVGRISVRIAHGESIALSVCSECQEKYLSLGVALVNPENDSAIVLMDEAYSALFSEPIPRQRIIHVKEELLEQIHGLFRDFKEYENRLALNDTFLEN